MDVHKCLMSVKRSRIEKSGLFRLVGTLYPTVKLGSFEALWRRETSACVGGGEGAKCVKLRSGWVWEERRSLWHGLLAACEQVEKLHAAKLGADDKDKDGILDWFGVTVKATEVADHVRRMAVLARKVCPIPCLIGSAVSSLLASAPQGR